MQLYGKVHNLKLKSNASYHQKRTATGTPASLICCLKSMQHRLTDVTPSRIPKSLYSRSILFKRTNNFGSVLPDRLARTIYKTKFPTHVSHLYPTLCLYYQCNVSFDAPNLPSVRDCNPVFTLLLLTAAVQTYRATLHTR